MTARTHYMTLKIIVCSHVGLVFLECNDLFEAELTESAPPMTNLLSQT